MTQSKTYTPTGARRSGDDYQDIVALDILVSMLEHPDRYEWVAVEAGEYRYLDDVVAIKSGGIAELRQVKFAAHPDEPDDEYAWANLLDTREGKKKKNGEKGMELPSLIGKWGTSLLTLLEKHAHIDGALVTNRKAAPDLAACLNTQTNKICVNNISSDILDEIIRQLGDRAKVDLFLDNFKFKMDQPGLEVWEEGVYRRFSNLGGGREGWLHLKEKVRSWVRDKMKPAPDGKIRLQDVHEAALWNRLEAMPQQFPIPPDYVLPSATFHDDVKERLADNDKGRVVLRGTPGIGKSTYLSYLYRELHDAKITVVRHHFFLSATDTTAGRFEHLGVIKSLMAELQRSAKSALKDLIQKNPSPEKFAQWLDACSLYYQKQRHPLVIIVDGLDHVWRDRKDIKGLNRLFEYLLPPRLGISIVIGTQPLADAQLPHRLLDAIPRKEWIDVPPLNRQSVLEWTKKNEGRLEIPKTIREEFRQERIQEIASAFYDVTHGQPLLLHYVLQALSGTRHSIRSDKIREQIAFSGGSITDYYRPLWTSLTDEARFVLIMVVSSGFEWPESCVHECCHRMNIDAIRVSNAWKKVSHLMLFSPLGWRPFHDSLGVFVKEQSDYGTHFRNINKAIAEWLEEEAPDYLRWAYSWTIQASLKNFNPLLEGTNRKWLVDSLVKGHSHSRACNLIEMAARKSLKDGDFYAYAKKSLLGEYTIYQYDFLEQEYRDLWTYIHLQNGSIEKLPYVLFSRKDDMTEGELAYLAEKLALEGDEEGAKIICDDLIDRYNSHQMSSSNNDWILDVTPIIWANGKTKTIRTERIIAAIKHNREGVDAIRLSHVYAETFRIQSKLGVLRNIVAAPLKQEERDIFLKHGFLLALEEEVDWSDIARDNADCVFAGIYACAKELSGFPFAEVTLPAVETTCNLSYISSEEVQTVKDCFEECFYKVLLCALEEQEAKIGHWLDSVGSHSWVRQFIQKLADAAISLADYILNKKPYTVANFYQYFAALSRPERNSADSAHEYCRIARMTLIGLSIDSILIASRTGKPVIEKDSLECICSSDFCFYSSWLNEYVKRRRCWLTPEAVEWLFSEYSDLSHLNMNELATEGIREATTLASTLALHDKMDNSQFCLQKAVELTLTYGYRKDILLHDYLKAIEKFAENSKESAIEHLAPVIPAILFVGEYTDGSETHVFPENLFKLLSKFKPEWLFPIYSSLCEREKYQEADDAFHSILSSLPFASPLEVAVGATALNRSCQALLSQRVQEGCGGAAQALCRIREFLGESPFEPAQRVNSDKSNDGQYRLDQDVEDIDIREYPPEQILEYWEALREKKIYRNEEALQTWIDHWKQESSLTVVRDALVKLKENQELTKCSVAIHELTVQLNGREAAWPWIIEAYRELNAWRFYWGCRKEVAKENWETVARHYPERWLEFLVETTAKALWSNDSVNVNGCLQRMVGYLTLLGQEIEAKHLLTGVHESIQELVAPFGVEADTARLQQAVPQQEQVLTLLLSRLTWPSGMVRERASNAIAGLLISDETRESVSTALTGWIKEQNMESIACIGLLPYIRARQMNPAIDIPSVEIFTSVCSCPSILYNSLLAIMFPESEIPSLEGDAHRDSAPQGFDVDSAFQVKYAHLRSPEQYTARHLENAFSVRFIAQWAFEFGQYSDAQKGYIGTATPFCSWADREHYFSFDTPRSEALRSSFLRALAWLAEQGEKHKDWAQAKAFGTMQIDLGLWLVQPQPIPEWWPFLKTTSSMDIDAISDKVIDALKSLWDRQNNDEWIMAMGNGRIAEGDAIYDLELFGVFQKCVGDVKPEACEIFSSEPWFQDRILLNRLSSSACGRPFAIKMNEACVNTMDWKLLSSVLRKQIHIVPRWQWWRLMHGPWSPLPQIALSGNYEAQCRTEMIIFRDGEEIIGYWQDWMAGTEEQLDANLTPRSGHILMLSKSAVDRFAKTHGYKYCWACHIKGFKRENGYGTFEEFDRYHSIDSSTNIVNFGESGTMPQR